MALLPKALKAFSAKGGGKPKMPFGKNAKKGDGKNPFAKKAAAESDPDDEDDEEPDEDEDEDEEEGGQKDDGTHPEPDGDEGQGGVGDDDGDEYNDEKIASIAAQVAAGTLPDDPDLADAAESYNPETDGTPSWVSDEALWEKAKGVVDPEGAGAKYDTPWVVVAAVFEEMGGAHV